MNRQEQIEQLVKEIETKKKEIIILQTLNIVENITFDELICSKIFHKRSGKIQEYNYYYCNIPLRTKYTQTKLKVCGGQVGKVDFNNDKIKQTIVEKIKKTAIEMCNNNEDIYVTKIYNKKYNK
jgi:hypothetical protein